MGLFGSGFLFVCMLLMMIVSWSTKHEYFDPQDPKTIQFGHKPRMKYITQLSCGQIIARLWMESYAPFDSKFEKEEDGTYTLTINSTTGRKDKHYRAKYKVLITPEQEGSAVCLFIFEYKADEHALDIIALELKRFLEKKLEAVRVE